ncbi:bifunctional [glutamine synthetase] adenylyltransferase/[glutamine synthetase]-adenylyl-L-tyrosine phosphorylase [Gordonia sp. (in: high G+C Gram-positive bacteria)]|uniref:bifunctional [glutamine synthetase] adenylyltransferase/[glutamine synthetase]-adenylyl-L-tyrosine phosphorylase n=1 Tax=Gordonia sp. (in: high G+C Gram-positive bacteria) TaxID=84139 RepID=UPI003C72AEDF
MTVSRGRSVVPSPGRLGLLQNDARERLGTLGWTGVDEVELLWSLSRAADADLALAALIRMRDADPDGWSEIDRHVRTDKHFRGRLFAVLGGSDALGDHLAAEPGVWRLLLADELPDAAAVRTSLLEAVDAEPVEDGAVEPGDLLYRAGLTGPNAVAALRRAYRDQVLILAAHDLAATVEDEPVLYLPEVGGRLSDLADAALTAALAVAITTVLDDKPLEGQIAVIAMGKCGARELNYVSDVDVVFVAEPADSVSARIAGEMMSIGSSAFFDVDAGLRPEGKRGVLTRTLESHITYYRRWAKTWEFQALLKARAMTGSMTLGAEYIAATSPMVWDASERDDFVPEVQAMRRRVEELIPAEEKSRNIKLGGGGLRDVEFAVQLLQMVHGRVDPDLHVQSTVDALAALTDGGYIGRDDGANFSASYQFLRLLEHRLQLQRLQRTHLLPEPSDKAGLRWLARAAHVRPQGDKDARQVLNEELRKQRGRVRQLHQKLFYRPLLESVARLDKGALRLSDESAKRQLAVLGWSFPDRALAHIRALGSAAGRSGQIQLLILPGLLEHISQTPDPDAGLLNYRRLCDEVVGVDWFLRLLRDDGVVAERLMHVLGTSEYIADLLMRSPDVIQLYSSGATGPKLTEVDSADVVKGLVASTMRAADLDRAVAVARSHRRAELARIASADLLGLMSVREVCRALSTVWAAVLGASLDKVIATTLVPGEPLPAKIAVIGMGRLGGGELGYGSDADVMFVCEASAGVAEETAMRWAQSVADQVRQMLGTPSADPPLEVDVGLRPEGKNGPIVRTLASYESYYRQWALPWEVQALLRAHTVAGDPDLGLRFLHMIDATRYPEGGVSSDAVKEIRRIKARIDSERLPRGADPATHTKLGRGGLADVEWTVQLTQLRYAHKHPELHNTSTLETLDAIGELGLLTQEQVEMLMDAWLTATKARNALVLVRGKPVDQLPGPGRMLRSVAYAAGWPQDQAQEFLEHYMRVTRRAKAVVVEVFES